MLQSHTEFETNDGSDESLWFRLFKAARFAVLAVPAYLVCVLVASDWWTFCVVFTRQKAEEGATVGAVLHWILLLPFNVVVLLLLVSYFRCIFTSNAVKDYLHDRRRELADHGAAVAPSSAAPATALNLRSVVSIGDEDNNRSNNNNNNNNGFGVFLFHACCGVSRNCGGCVSVV
eukprot:TRINITY_DN66096_c5_g1_i1.p2 TRINITY_DN66096_c5_g1~~TRINITY_DN66096_c5_g1_i1.p2  ORF type:complete len:175 (-),score=66.63 TRINITY_DN66096_c5_g1_i1:330-854(-)